MQIIVLGMHRSGTSLTTRIINMMGAYFGPEGMCSYHNENPKGFWERRDVIQCNASLLKMHYPEWADIIVSPWIANWPVPQAKELQHQMKSIVLSMDGFRPWVMKDPHLCITLPQWRPLLEVPVCVMVYRDPLEVAYSLKIRERGAVPSIERSMALWEYYAVSMLNASIDMPRVFVSHSDFMLDPINTTVQLYNALCAEGVQGIRLPGSKEIMAFMDGSLYRAKPDEELRQNYSMSAYQESLAEMLQGETLPSGTLHLSESARRILREPVTEQAV